jgi:hypothetical protein
MILLHPHPLTPVLLSESSAGDNQEVCERATTSWQESGRGGGGGAKSYDDKKALSALMIRYSLGWNHVEG